ncbi:MAG: GyrI-like domain-containing protein [Oscillospiraceae bacterium]|nr:GyrI-like domain-containing protein [Oscillospiraceae bacterium]
MAKIIKVYKENVPALRFIGKKYLDADRVDGSFGAKWGEWFENDWFGLLEKLHNGNLADYHENGGAYIGLMRDTVEGVFEYYVGIFMPKDTAPPENFTFVDFPAGELGVCWVYGAEHEVYMHEGECGERLTAEGFNVDGSWCFERYACPRFTAPDEKGNVTLDICFYIKS